MSAGLVGWVVIIAAGLVWEAIGIRIGNDAAWPTLSSLIRLFPKWLIVGALAVLAWHLLSP